MFILSKFTDLLHLPPPTFAHPTATALEDQINEKYANKVVHNIGLCISLYDLSSVSEGMIGQDGGAHVNVEFRMIVFRPFKGEVLTGRISSATAAGVKVRTDFFDEVFVPAAALFEGSRFDGKEQVWIWRNDDQDFYMDKNEVIRFRVEGEVFVDQLPVPPHLKGEESSLHNKPPYAITVGFSSALLMCSQLWAN
ncbi:unnamed protein product [Tuber melanosporum]|uniref:DNA-directed RNA polymerase subunit n=1 Tax=Tuber melanosporum (strain Mel28) TaxID=656061 RepID=D5GKL8_TUBMM|nr:uncharacterized protein GSTUM_00009634001 [Tuber melanosporum]CAZ85061.1 unnamed protein product [Tuber melanosporum]